MNSPPMNLGFWGGGNAFALNQARVLQQIAQLLGQINGPERVRTDAVEQFTNLFRCVHEGISTTGVYYEERQPPTPENPLQLAFDDPEQYHSCKLAPDTQVTASDFFNTLASECSKKIISGFDALDLLQLQEMLFKDELFADLYEVMKNGLPLPQQIQGIVGRFLAARRAERQKRGMGCNYGARLAADEGGNIELTVPQPSSPDSSAVPLTSTIGPLVMDFTSRFILSMPQRSLENVAQSLSLVRLVAQTLFARASSTASGLMISWLMKKIRIYPELEPLTRSLKSLNPAFPDNIANIANDLFAHSINLVMSKAAEQDPDEHAYQEAQMLIVQSIISRQWEARRAACRPLRTALHAFLPNSGTNAFFQRLLQRQNHPLRVYGMPPAINYGAGSAVYHHTLQAANDNQFASTQNVTNEGAGMGYMPHPGAIPLQSSNQTMTSHYASATHSRISATPAPNSGYGTNTRYASAEHMHSQSERSRQPANVLSPQPSASGTNAQFAAPTIPVYDPSYVQTQPGGYSQAQGAQTGAAQVRWVPAQDEALRDVGQFQQMGDGAIGGKMTNMHRNFQH